MSAHAAPLFGCARLFGLLVTGGGIAPLSSEAKEEAKLKTVGNLNITATALEPS
ncbi:hypothetical protein [Ochrobactrum chromiisoli]|uniref:Uncharacterized protein n=1 Tax=Ochrobactrum chromiisoli TaxID=2993941 RepID=A0ABT3QRU3_9HYPH|nr:hypothetical protein [Ochrobactrum chromiisoli]MCX2698337.1 hypothetical protein [Ochrobactrum chromiisoli]